jgi:hypothetical protein
MHPLIRQYAPYAGAVLAGAIAAPLLHYGNAWELVLSHLQKALLVGSIGALLTVAWLLRKDYPHRTRWVAAEVGLIVLMLPVAVGSGVAVYESSTAWRGESVHWHADLTVIVDGEHQNLIDPRNFCDGILCPFSNHTGTASVHEHGDGRIHIHGPVQRPQDATLGAFFDAVGGQLTGEQLVFPTNDGRIDRETTGEKRLTVLVRTGPDRSWRVLDDPAGYRIAPYTEGQTDTVVAVYDDAAPATVQADVRDDGIYRGVRVQ